MQTTVKTLALLLPHGMSANYLTWNSACSVFNVPVSPQARA
jgi:hypothetical protein